MQPDKAQNGHLNKPGYRTHNGPSNGHLNLGFSAGELRDHRSETTVIPMAPALTSPMMTLTVLGTGDFGQALSACLTRAGYRVLLASRNPDNARKRGVNPQCCSAVVGVSEGLASSEVVVMAIPFGGQLPQENQVNKIIIDVRNRASRGSRPPPEGSLGASLQAQLPNSRVVKAFNTLSAYSLFRGIQQGGKQVPYCGNDPDAKSLVGSIIRRLGYIPEDRGTIEQSGALEDIPHTFFPEWRVPLAIAGAVMSFFWLVMLFRRELCPNFESGLDWNWQLFKRLILNQAQLTFALTAFTLLTFCYTPGVLAAYLQLYRRTKYSKFPKWLDSWLKSRKQMGLIALQLALTHAIGGAIHVLMENEEADWRSDSFFICGIFAFGLMVLLGVTSLPSVGTALSWQEFSFLQRYCGWGALTFACLHAIFVKWDGLIANNFQCVFIPDQLQIGIVLPLLTILLKLPLLLPCIDSRLNSIRGGGS